MNYTVSLRKRGEKWSYQIIIGKKYHSGKLGFRTKGEAKKAGDKAAQRINTPEKKVDTFKQIAESYIASKPREKGTLSTYKSWLESMKDIHDIEIVKLKYSHVMPMIMAYYINSKHSSTMSIVNFGKSVCKYAIEMLDFEMKNPFIKVSFEKKADKKKREIKVITESEMAKLFSKIENQDMKFLVMAMGLGGLRVSEARGLTFNNFGKDTFFVTQQRQKIRKEIIVKTNTKSHNSIREIPLKKELKAAFQEFPMNIDKSELVVSKFYDTQTLNRLYKKLGYDITNHSLRHSYATIAIQKGLDFKTVAYLIGDTVEMVMKTYAHVNSDMLENAKKVLTNY